MAGARFMILTKLLVYISFAVAFLFEAFFLSTKHLLDEYRIYIFRWPKQVRIQTAKQLLKLFRNSRPFANNGIGYKAWVHYFEPVRKN